MPLEIPRRKFLLGLGLCLAAPAMIKIENLMKLASPKLITKINQAEMLDEDFVSSFGKNSLWTINEITREAVRLFNNSNEFLINVDFEHEWQKPLWKVKLLERFD